MIKIKLTELRNQKDVRVFSGMINKKSFKIEVDKSMNLDNRTIKNWAKNWIFANMEVIL